MKNHGELLNHANRANVIGHVANYNAQNIAIDKFDNTQQRQETLQTDLHHVEESLRDLLRNNAMELNCKKGDTQTQMEQYKNAIAHCKNHIQSMEDENQSLKKHISLLQSFPASTGGPDVFQDKPQATTQQMRLEDVITQCTTLSDRIRKMEDHNSRLVEEAAKQKCEYERCLDKVASQVVQALLTQRRLQSECCLLRSQVRKLAISNQLDDTTSNNGYSGCYSGFNPAEISFPSQTDEISKFLSDLTESLHSAGFSKHALTETLSNCPTLPMRDNKAPHPNMTSPQMSGRPLTHQPIVYPEMTRHVMPREHQPVAYMNFNPYHLQNQHLNVPMYQNVEMAKSPPPPLHMIPETMEPRHYENHRVWNTGESNMMEQNKVNQRFNENDNRGKYVLPSEQSYERKPVTRSHSFDNYQFVHNQQSRTDEHSRHSIHGNITHRQQEQATDRRDHVYSNKETTEAINQSYHHHHEPARAQCIANSNDVNSNNNNSIAFHQSYPSFERGRSRNINRNRHMSPPQVRTNKSQRTFSPPTHRRSRSFDVNLQEQHKQNNDALWMQRHHSNEPQCRLSSASSSSLRSPNVQSNRKKLSSKSSSYKDLPPPPPPPPQVNETQPTTKSAPSSPATSPRLPLSVWKTNDEGRRLLPKKKDVVKEQFLPLEIESKKKTSSKVEPEKLPPKKVLLETNIDEIEPVKLPKKQETKPVAVEKTPAAGNVDLQSCEHDVKKTKVVEPPVVRSQPQEEKPPATPDVPPRTKKNVTNATPSTKITLTHTKNEEKTTKEVDKETTKVSEDPQKISLQGSRLKKSRLAAPAGSKSRLLRERSKSEKLRPNACKANAPKHTTSPESGSDNALRKDLMFSKAPLRRTVSGGEKSKQNFYETSLISSNNPVAAVAKPQSTLIQKTQPQESSKPTISSKSSKDVPKKKLSQQKSLVGLMKARFGKSSGVQSKKTEAKQQTPSAEKVEISSPIDFRTLSLEPNAHPPANNHEKKMTKQKIIEEQHGQIGRKLSQPLSHTQYTKPNPIDEETERKVQDFMNRQNSRRGRSGIRYNPKDQFETSVELIPIGNRVKGSGNSLDVMMRNVENARNKNTKRFSYTDKTTSPVASESGKLSKEVIKQKSASLDKDKVIRRQNDFENVVVNKGAASKNIKMRSSKRRSRHDYENVVIVPGKPPLPNDNHPKNKLEKLWKSVSTHSLSKESVSSHGSRGNISQTNEDDGKPPSQLCQQTSYEKAIISSIVQAELDDIKSESKKSESCKSSVNFSTTSSSKSSTSFDSWPSSSEDSTNRSTNNISFDGSPKPQITTPTKVTSKLPSGSRSSLGSFGYGSGTSNSSASSNGSFPEKQSSLSSGNISQSNISKSYLTPPTQTNSDEKPMRKSLSPMRSISQENKLKDSRLTRSGGIPTSRMKMGVRSIATDNNNSKIQSGKPLSSKLIGGFGFSGVKSHSQGDVTPQKLAPLSYGTPKPVNQSNGSLAYSNASYGQIAHNIPRKIPVQKV